MNKAEAIEYLTRCADQFGTHWYQGRAWAMANCPNDIASCPTCKGSNDAGHLGAPGSRYGYTSAHCAVVAYDYARRVEQDTTESTLDSVMRLVVNDSGDIEEGLRDYAISHATGVDIDAMVQGYLVCQLWAQQDYDHDDSMLDAHYGVDDIDAEYVDKITAELSDFVASHPLAVRMYLAQRDPINGGANGSFGHDFYLTREGHGAGFWDRGLGELGDYLSTWCKYNGAADDLFDNGLGVLS